MTASQGIPLQSFESRSSSCVCVTAQTSSSPGVELFLGAYSRQSVSPHGFSDPPTPFDTALRYSRPTPLHPLSQRPRMLWHPRTYSLLQSMTGPDRCLNRQLALLGFGPLQRFKFRKPGQLGLASPDTFRLQGFSPSCRLASSGTFWPCFMPVALMGLPFRAFSPRRAFSFFQSMVPS